VDNRTSKIEQQSSIYEGETRTSTHIVFSQLGVILVRNLSYCMAAGQIDKGKSPLPSFTTPR
jgi:hypothetical protein